MEVTRQNIRTLLKYISADKEERKNITGDVLRAFDRTRWDHTDDSLLQDCIDELSEIISDTHAHMTVVESADLHRCKSKNP